MKEQLVSLIREGHEAIVNEEEVENYNATVDKFIEEFTSTIIKQGHERLLNIIRKYEAAEETVENGKRYLVFEDGKIPYGYPYPDSKAGSTLKEIRRQLSI